MQADTELTENDVHHTPIVMHIYWCVGSPGCLNRCQYIIRIFSLPDVVKIVHMKSPEYETASLGCPLAL